MVDTAQGLLRVDGQEIRTAHSLAGKANGEKLALALRPELVSLEEGNNPEQNRLRGRVENIAFLGSVVRMTVRLHEQSVLLDLFNNPHLALPALGSTVTTTFSTEACLVLG